MYLSTILTLCTTFALVTPQAPQQFIQNPCDSKSTCHECIRTPSCAWCFDTKFNTTKRCFQPSYPKPPLDQCDPSQVYNPDNVIVFLQNDNLTSSEIRKEDGTLVSGYEASMNSSEYFQGKGQSHFGGSGVSGGRYGASIVQVKPQRISLQLRAREIYRIDMAYARAEHYPVDLYYLMDLSKSMEDDKEKLSALGNHLADTMKRVTSNFTLGFGSFVDKVVMPYVSTIPEKLLQPCTGCVAPYGFRNHMTLSTNTNTFSQMVKEASVSGNLDAPEGGFDAIMQAVVCRQNIGWRDQTRRLLVFSTDAGFHYAGDGKLGGIVKPNDGECHLNNLGYYTMSSKQDYPSISQINTYVKKNSINVIFAVTADKVGIYKELATHIEGSTCGQLSNDSSNVVELIKEQYNAISSTVEMKHNASSDIKIRFFSKCLNSDGEMIETNKCGNVKFNTSVEFRVELQIISGPQCECDNFSCERHNGLICSGPEHGCRQYKTGPYKTEKECESNPICNFHIVEKDVIEVNETNNEVLCAHYDEETDCRFTFVYYYNETNQIEIRAQKELECPPIVFLLGVILGVIAAVVLMGLAVLLLWKLLTTIHDRREFAKFEKEAMMARWDTGENPIYKQATSTFKNPTYAGKG
ncbi:integrin beta-PS, partial [Asbolus verrucosus]